MDNKRSGFASIAAEIQGVLAGNPPEGNKGILPGISSIAAGIGTYGPGLNLITGSQGTGKTMMMVTEATTLAERGNSVLYVTTEQTKRVLERMMVTAVTNKTATGAFVTIDDVKYSSYRSKEEADEATEASYILDTLDIQIDDKIETASGLDGLIESMENKPDIIIIDSITNLRSSKDLTDEVLDSKQKALDLLAISRKYNAPIVGIIQASKAGITNVISKKKNLSGDDAIAISGSQTQVYNADTVCILRPSTRKKAFTGILEEAKRYVLESGDDTFVLPEIEDSEGSEENEIWTELCWIKAREAGIDYTENKTTYAVRIPQTAKVYGPDVYIEIEERKAMARRTRWERLAREANRHVG